MTSILLAAALICSRPVIVNKSTEKFGTIIDVKTLEMAKDGCIRHFPKLPCLKKLIKKDIRSYHAECGPKE